MTNVIKKHSISSELAQRMVDEAVAKARTIGVSVAVIGVVLLATIAASVWQKSTPSHLNTMRSNN